jgi:thiosulfate dehydrogenase [quinone] large subunit
MDREGFRLSRAAMVAIVLLRVAIGWHFLYEGVAKLQKPGWSAAGYLQQSRGVLADLFKWMAGNPNVLEVVNPLNMWGLTLIGLGLILGCFTRLSAAAGMLIVLMYYLANPPWGATSTRSPWRGAT